MSKLPVLSGIKAVKAFSKLGWKPVRQTGNHVILMREESDVTLSIPLHETLKKGLLSALLKDAGITVDELIKNL